MHGCNTASSGKSCHCSCLEPANWTSIWAILALCCPNAVEVIIIKAIPCTCSAAKLYITCTSKHKPKLLKALVFD